MCLSTKVYSKRSCFNMISKQPSWDRYEAIILLEGLLASLNGQIARADAIKNISQDLRKLAFHRGIKIDATYRNENGISFQLRSMESAYYGQTIFKPATKLFAETVAIYHNSRDEYCKLLKEAQAMINGSNSVEKDFMDYLASKMPPSQLSNMYLFYSEIESFNLKVRVLQKPLFQTTDLEIIKKVQRTIEQNKIFRITHKKQLQKIIVAGQYYYTYIKEGRYLQITEAPVTVTDQINAPLQSTCSPIVNCTTSEESPNIPLVRNEYDKKLLQKYPSIYAQVLDAIKSLSSIGTKDVSIGEIYEKTNQIARPSEIEEILDNASWARIVDKNYTFSIEGIDHSVVAAEPNEKSAEKVSTDNAICSIDFNGKFDLAYTKPEEFSYFGNAKICGNSWTTLYVNLVETLIRDYPHIFIEGMSFSKSGGRIELSNNTDYSFMWVPKPVPGTDYVLETNVSASNMAKKIKYILDLCNINYENIVITYRKKDSSTYSPDHEQKSKSFCSTVDAKINSSTFTRYMAETLNMSENTCRSYTSAINNCEAFAKEHQLSSCRLYTSDADEAQETAQQLLSSEDFLEYNARQHNRFRAALQKLFSFIGTDLPQTGSISQVPEVAPSYKNEIYEAVLKQYFKKGFHTESPLEIRKFRRYYTSIYNNELLDLDTDIAREIKLLCIIHNGKAFLPEVMLSEELKERLFKYIEDSFIAGKTAIYYQAIYTEFAEAFLDYYIHDADMLKSYLTFVSNGQFYINKNFISKEANVVLDPLSEIRSCLQEYGRPAEYDELFQALPHLPQSKIKVILASNGEFVNNGLGAYFHESIVRLSDEELEEIARIIQGTINDKDFIGGNELYDAIQMKFPYIVQDNHNLSVYGFRDALKVKLGHRFSFKGNIISQIGQEISMADVFAKYAKSHDSFSLSELQGLASNLASSIYFDPVYENSLRISRDQFVSKESVQFSIPDTDEAIGRVCIGNYIPIQAVTNFGVFPYSGFPWTSFLLEHYVAHYSQKYILLHSSFNGTECAGAIVKRSAKINSFDDLITDLLTNSSIEMKKAPVLQFLSDTGYLARRRYSEIESLIIKANAQRQRKDNN